MDIMSHIKKDCLDPNRAMASALGAPMGSGYIASLLGHGGAKLGAWQVHYCDLAGRKYYSHTVTGERQWDIPDDARFFIPSKLLTKLLTVFDYGHLENFKYQFTMIYPRLS